MKGIILAGGNGKRLYPTTKAISKQLIPIFDKPMIYYPLSVLMLAGIKEILIISTERDIPMFKTLLGNGAHFGLSLEYTVQCKPNGLAEAFILGEAFIGNDSVALILGDNVFYGDGLIERLKSASRRHGATIFGYHVATPQDFGVVEFDKLGAVVSIEEKPQMPKSNYIVPGLYFYDNDVVSIAKMLEPSERGELEITDINNRYLKMHKLNVELLGRGITWLDAGTHQGLLSASNYIAAIQSRQGQYIACIEEIAFRQGFINKKQLLKLAEPMMEVDYGKYLYQLAEEKAF